MNTWRAKRLEYTFRRGLMHNYVDFLSCTKQSLDYTCSNLICWKFGELIKTLITLASAAERQVEIIGEIEVATDEMAIDFDNYFSTTSQTYLDYNLLTLKQYGKLIELNTFFSERCEEKFSDFWDDENLSKSADWQNVREHAKLILCLLKMGDLDLKIDRTKEYKLKNGVKHLTGESTKLFIIKKSSKIMILNNEIAA